MKVSRPATNAHNLAIERSQAIDVDMHDFALAFDLASDDEPGAISRTTARTNVLVTQD